MTLLTGLSWPFQARRGTVQQAPRPNRRPTLLRKPATSGRVGHVPALDGTRGLAVAAVVCYHLDPSVVPGGFLGVSLFFTLSGFLITNLLLAEWQQTGHIEVRSFWQRRFRRLLPASLAGIALVVVMAPAVWDPSQLRDLPGDVIASLAYVANWRFIVSGDAYAAGFEAPSPLLHYWSLAIEEQFYLVVGVLTIWLGRVASKRQWFLVFGGMAIASMAATVLLYDPLSTDRVYFGSLTRAFELLAGVLLALLIGLTTPSRLRRIATAAGPVLLVAMVAAFLAVEITDTFLYRGGFWLMALLSCGLIVSAISGGTFAKVLSWRPLTALGLISYGVYVYHWPLFLWLTEDRTGLDGWALVTVRLIATFTLAIASFVLLERPVRERSFGLRGPAAFACVAGVSVLLAGGSVLVSQDAEDGAVAGSAPSIDLTGKDVPPASSADPPNTTTVQALPPERVLFMGDSLAYQAFPTIENRLVEAGADVQLIGGAGETMMTNQAEWLGELQSTVDDFDPDVVVLESCCGAGDPRRPDPYVGSDGEVIEPDSEAQLAEWRRLSREASDIAASNGAQVLWVLAPPARTNGYYGPIEERIGVVNGVYLDLVACDTTLGVVDWSLLSGPGGAYTESLPDASGTLVQVRTADGLHFTDAGQALLADLTRDVVLDSWTGRRDPTVPTEPGPDCPTPG